MDKGGHGFSGRKPRPASFSSWTGDGPPASSASPDTISAPEKLRRTFQRGKIGAGEEEDDGGVAWHLPPGLPRPVPLGRGWRPPRTMTMSSADFLPLESVSALVHRGYVFFGIFLLSRSVFHISLDPMIDSLRGPRFAVRWAFCGKAPVFRRENVFQTQFCAVVSIN